MPLKEDLVFGNENIKIILERIFFELIQAQDGKWVLGELKSEVCVMIDATMKAILNYY